MLHSLSEPQTNQIRRKDQSERPAGFRKRHEQIHHLELGELLDLLAGGRKHAENVEANLSPIC